MNRTMLFVIFLPLFLVNGMAGEITLSGNYYGNNLVVLNPSRGEGFCVTEVRVNGSLTGDEIRSNSFEIDLEVLGLQTGDPVHVVIRHHDGCTPRIVNSQALRGDQFFSFSVVRFDRSAKLNWNVKGDLGDDPFIIEQLRWNKWAEAGEVAVSDTMAGAHYVFDPQFHSGINYFRVLRIDAYGNPVYSKIARYNNARVPMVDIESTKVTDKIVFSAETIYELFDEKGNYLTGGFAKEVIVSDLSRGKYFLSYDVKSAIINKR